ncbi:hypothetical protein CC2G_005282 [Coprinopsis cinerea AmutBmut pab1-1]|nr:hypothetical protein CC2G_005282 [Coprinopsis cinerea AmutBmut pab1-1]
MSGNKPSSSTLEILYELVFRVRALRINCRNFWWREDDRDRGRAGPVGETEWRNGRYIHEGRVWTSAVCWNGKGVGTRSGGSLRWRGALAFTKASSLGDHRVNRHGDSLDTYCYASAASESGTESVGVGRRQGRESGVGLDAAGWAVSRDADAHLRYAYIRVTWPIGPRTQRAAKQQEVFKSASRREIWKIDRGTTRSPGGADECL